MRYLRTLSLALFAAGLTLGCATHDANQKDASKDASKEAQKQANKNPRGVTVPASIYQGYNVTGEIQ